MSQPAKVPTSQLIFPSAENTTTVQLQNLLNIGGFAMTALIQAGPDTEFPAEAKIAAENTFIKMLETLDGMLLERCRWSLETQQRLEADFNRAHKLNLEYLEAQVKTQQLLTAPHFRLHPSLHRLVDGRFAAILGSLDDLKNAVVGIGVSPESALSDFDKTFSEGQSTPLAITKHQTTNEQNTTDGQPNQPDNKPSRRRKK